MTIQRQPLAYGLIFMALSIAIEIVLLIVVRLHIPEDNAIIAPILLIASPVAGAWICGYRRPGWLLLLAVLTVVWTLVFVMIYSRLTGIKTGLIEPIIVRTSAGALAALIINRLSTRA